MDEMAKSAGISRATLHRQFAGRDGLVVELEELGIREVEAALDAAELEDGKASEALRRLADRIQPSAGLLAFLMSQAQLFEGGNTNPGWDRIDQRITALFRRGQEDGEFRIDQQPAWLAEAIYGLVSAAVWSIQAGLAGQAQFQTMIVDLLLDGVRRPA
ncbi:helix-turn-helix transcriptional regulator [Microlunatus elymi]|uniref:Helix-turn-helix transcriptional regulator n=2 Tax=Microlunatus elymi TaxID=2596828 RepID=A0A516Q6G0_9ACTN|nr:helix-turn-helix transcriptional regulator [Microlunatus elymi]